MQHEHLHLYAVPQPMPQIEPIGHSLIELWGDQFKT